MKLQQLLILCLDFEVKCVTAFLVFVNNEKRCFDPFDNSTIRGYSVLKRLMDVAATLKVLFVLYGNDDTFNK